MTTLARFTLALITMLVPLSAFAQAPVAPDPSQRSPTVPLACISVQRAFSESVDGRVAIALLAAVQDEKARAIDEKNKALLAQEQALQQSLSFLSEEARTQRRVQLEKFRIEVQRLTQDAQAELAGLQRESERAFLVRLTPALERVTRDKGLLLVFNVDAGLIPWFAPSIDITADVVKQLAQK